MGFRGETRILVAKHVGDGTRQLVGLNRGRRVPQDTGVERYGFTVVLDGNVEVRIVRDDGRGLKDVADTAERMTPTDDDLSRDCPPGGRCGRVDVPVTVKGDPDCDFEDFARSNVLSGGGDFEVCRILCLDVSAESEE